MIYSKNTNELITKYIVPERIVCSFEIQNKNVLLADTPRQPVLANVDVCRFNAGSYVLLDFGEELSGGIDITVHTVENNSAALRITFGESVMEAMSNIGEKNSTNDHAVRDSVVTVGNYSNFRTGQTGFRFVKIEAMGCCVNISGIRAAFDYKDIEYKGSFESDDLLLNKIWQTGARTVHLCMQDFLWDGIKRDRLVWIGDMHAEVSAVGCVFGADSIVDKSLDYIMNVTGKGEWMNTIPSYSLWWLIIKYEWYMQTGNINALIFNREYILSLADFVASSVNDDGTDRFFGKNIVGGSDGPFGGYFIDWETFNTPESKNGFYSVLVLALRAAVKLCEILDASDTKNKCLGKLNVISKIKFGKASNRQMASLMALADLADAKETNISVLKKEPVADVSAYLGYYTLLAKAKAGDETGALDIIRNYWGRMLELGATSFWESFDYLGSFDAVGIDQIVPEGKKDIHADGGNFCYKGFRRSLCHGWACGPTPFISKHILGVTPLEPGFKKVSVKPVPGNLKHISGTYPTPYGNIEITAEVKGGEVLSHIKAPKEIEII